MGNNEISRFKDFCQFKAEIRGSSEYLLVGIDIGKDKNHSFFGTATGKTLWRKLVFTNDMIGFNRLVDQTTMIKSQHQLSKTVFSLEPTGNYHKPLANFLIKNGFMVTYVTGKAVKDNRELLDGRWDKNDIKDSANIADLNSQGKCQFYSFLDDKIVTLRGFLATRNLLKKDEHRIRMQIRNDLLAKYFPEMDRLWGHSLEENLAIVRWYLDPVKIAETEFATFVRHVTTKDKGLVQLKRLQAIYDAAKQSVGLPVDSSAWFKAEILVERLKLTREQISETMQQIRTLCKSIPEYNLVLTIPGFGPYISALVVAQIANPNRFNSRKQVIRLAGLDLNAKRSGKTSKQAVPVISKKGNSDLRYALYQAALIASNRNDVFRKYFTHILEGREKERGIKIKARVKIAAKLLVIAWTIMKNREPFDPYKIFDSTGA